jgi:hypothetical protein
MEDIHAGTARNQEQRDVLAAHVTSAAEGGFPVASAPIPGRIEQAGFLGEQCLGAIEIEVADTNKLLDHVEVQARRFGRSLHGTLRENPLGRARATPAPTVEAAAPDRKPLRDTCVSFMRVPFDWKR